MRKEMLMFENRGTRSDFLQRAYNFLMTIKPTSVEFERAFLRPDFLQQNKKSFWR